MLEEDWAEQPLGIESPSSQTRGTQTFTKPYSLSGQRLLGHFDLTFHQKEDRYLAQILIPSPKISKKLWRLVV